MATVRRSMKNFRWRPLANYTSTVLLSDADFNVIFIDKSVIGTGLVCHTVSAIV